MPDVIQTLENPESLAGDTLARKWVIDVDMNYGINGSATWTRLRGIQEQSPSEDPERQDSSTYDSLGWKSEAVTAMGWGWEITVARKTASDGVTYDPAQEYLRLKSLQMGPSNVAHVRVYEWNGVNGPRVQAYEGLVGVSYAEQGGSMEALSSAKFTLSGQGARRDIVHPAGPSAWVSATVYATGAQVYGSDGTVLQATQGGTAGTVKPSKTTLTDGTVKWRALTSV